MIELPLCKYGYWWVQPVPGPWLWGSQPLPSMSRTGQWFDNTRVVSFMCPVQGGDMSWFGGSIASPAVGIGVRVKKFHNEFISHTENLLSETELNYGQEWCGSQKERRTYTVMSNSLRHQTEWTHLLSGWPWTWEFSCSWFPFTRKWAECDGTWGPTHSTGTVTSWRDRRAVGALCQIAGNVQSLEHLPKTLPFPCSDEETPNSEHNWLVLGAMLMPSGVKAERSWRCAAFQRRRAAPQVLSCRAVEQEVQPPENVWAVASHAK